MPDPARALTLQLLQWIHQRSCTREEVLDAWRTSCPRLSIWEDACVDGLVEFPPGDGFVRVSAKGRALLQAATDSASAFAQTSS